MDLSNELAAFGSLFELSRDAVIGLENNRIVFVNPCARELLGLDAGMDAAERLPEELLQDKTERCITRHKLAGQSFTISSRRFGENRLLCFTPVDPPEPGVTRSPGYKAVREMSDSLAELRMTLDAVMRQSDLTERFCGYFSIAYRDYFRLQRLCNHLSTAANLSDGKLPFSPRIINLKRLVSELCESVQGFSDSLSASLECRIEDGDYYTFADESLLETMLLNVLSNSMLHCTKDDSVRVTLQERNRRYLLSVDDSGSGMSSDKLLHAFDPNKDISLTDSTAGIGLGLLIAQGIAEMHDGSLLLDSTGQDGCHVRITIPQKDAPKMILHSPLPVDKAGKTNLLFTELVKSLPAKVFIERFLD